MRPSDRAWITLGAGVLAWDVVCPDNEMFSNASTRYAQDHPVLAYAVIGAVAAHLVNRIPARVDPIHWVGAGLRKLKA